MKKEEILKLQHVCRKMEINVDYLEQKLGLDSTQFESLMKKLFDFLNDLNKEIEEIINKGD